MTPFLGGQGWDSDAGIFSGDPRRDPRLCTYTFDTHQHVHCHTRTHTHNRTCIALGGTTQTSRSQARLTQRQVRVHVETFLEGGCVWCDTAVVRLQTFPFVYDTTHTTRIQRGGNGGLRVAPAWSAAPCSSEEPCLRAASAASKRAPLSARDFESSSVPVSLAL